MNGHGQETLVWAGAHGAATVVASSSVSIGS